MSLDGRIRQGLVQAADSVEPNVEGDLMKVQSRSRNRRRMQWAAGAVAVAAIGAFFFLGGTDLFDSTGDAAPIPPASTGGDGTVAPTIEPSPEETPPATGTGNPLEIWFTKGETLFPDIPGVYEASDPNLNSVATDAVEILLLEENADNAGLRTQIPPGTVVREVAIEDGLATVDLAEKFESGGGSLSMRARVAQVVYTLTQFDSVDAVLFKLDGVSVDSIGGEGVDVSTPQTRQDYEDLLAPIVVTNLGRGWDLPSGYSIDGIANVFEANVSWRVLDETGNEIANGFTTATCGTGCWGDFTIEAEFSIDQDQPGTIEVLEYSAENGEPINVVSIPVNLLAE